MEECVWSFFLMVIIFYLLVVVDFGLNSFWLIVGCVEEMLVGS